MLLDDVLLTVLLEVEFVVVGAGSASPVLLPHATNVNAAAVRITVSRFIDLLR
ncbi:hypothetical protein [Corynebacterium propinquum]|uniref:hypothetical protein n=1 Tax=Corynebacterium propinquum TaxID=43769 RepID=UPI0013791328|nr:hypothetical protein [Corynebacterium propinquum]